MGWSKLSGSGKFAFRFDAELNRLCGGFVRNGESTSRIARMELTSRSAEEVAEFASKIRVYAISDQVGTRSNDLQRAAR